MTTKREALTQAASGLGCLGKARDDEPVFILRAQDRFAPQLVEEWARLVDDNVRFAVSEAADNSKRKASRARALAHQMRAWQELNKSKTPD